MSESVVSDLVLGSDENPLLLNVPEAFAAIPSSGHVSKKSFTGPDDLISHIQGMAVYKHRYIIMTHDAEDGPGYFYVYDLHSGKTHKEDVRTPKGNHHPAGVQILGDYLVVGVEPSADKDHPSWIYFYDLTGLDDKNLGPRRLPHPQIEQPGKGAAAVGLAKVAGSYVLAVYGSTPGGLINFYGSNGKRLGDPDLVFDTTPIFSFRAHDTKGKGVGFDNLALLTDRNQALYLIGLRGDDHDSTISDYGDLWSVDLSHKSARLVQGRHFYTDTELEGEVGPHFRYGAGATAVDATMLQLYCSPRSLLPVLPLHVDLVFNMFGNHDRW
jgi:hypothetical protein